MLVLTRRIGEFIVIGEDINVRVLGVKGNQIRLGIDAPKLTSVHREEIYLKIKKNGNCEDCLNFSNFNQYEENQTIN